jgi:hypothetical protein
MDKSEVVAWLRPLPDRTTFSVWLRSPELLRARPDSTRSSGRCSEPPVAAIELILDLDRAEIQRLPRYPAFPTRTERIRWQIYPK